MTEREQIVQWLLAQEHLALKHEGATSNHEDAVYYNGKASAFSEAAVIIAGGLLKLNQ